MTAPSWQAPLLRLQSDLTVVLERAPMCVATLPLVTVSEANRRDRWGRAKRAKAARTGAHMAIGSEMRRNWPLGGWAGSSLVVLLVRLSPRPLDDDNLASALKAVRDGVADALGVDDRDARVGWVVSQERGKAAVRISIYEGRAS